MSLRLTSALALSVAAIAMQSAVAVTTPIAHYRLGENDPGAVSGGAGNALTIDSAGAPDNLTKVGAPTYANGLVPGSSLSMNLNGVGDVYSAPALPIGTNNFAIEAFITYDSGGNILPVNNGHGAFNGAGLLVHNANRPAGEQAWQGLYGGNAFLTTNVPAIPGVTTHLAVVRDSGITTVYVNGVAKHVSGAGPNAPAGTMDIGAFDGRVDEARVATFAAGTFNASTDLLFPFSNAPGMTNIYQNGFEPADAGEFTSVGNGGVAPAAAYGITTTEGANLFAFNGGGFPANAVVTSSIIDAVAGAPSFLYFDYGNFGANEPQSLRVEVIDVLTNTAILNQVISDNTGEGTVNLYSPWYFAFTPTNGDIRLRFTDLAGASVAGSSDGMLDNIRVTQIVALPEPATMSLLGLAGLALLRRRRVA